MFRDFIAVMIVAALFSISINLGRIRNELWRANETAMCLKMMELKMKVDITEKGCRVPRTSTTAKGEGE